MMEAWLSASETIKSPTPVKAWITPALQLKPDWKSKTASSRLKTELFVQRHVSDDGLDGSRADPEFPYRGDRGFFQTRMVREAQVIVGGKVDDLMPVDDDLGFVGTLDDRDFPKKTLLFEFLYLVLKKFKFMDIAHRFSFSPMRSTTFPQFPSCINRKP
jgi:hypothetical protein